MASNPQKQRDLNKLGKEAFAILSNFPPRTGKAKLVPVKNGSGKNEKCIDAYQAAKKYGGYVLTACPPPSQTKTVKQPVTKEVCTVCISTTTRVLPECCCSS